MVAGDQHAIRGLLQLLSELFRKRGLADGDLAVTAPLPGLTAGRAVKIMGS